jgi:hypothetical protein
MTWVRLIATMNTCPFMGAVRGVAWSRTSTATDSGSASVDA